MKYHCLWTAGSPMPMASRRYDWEALQLQTVGMAPGDRVALSAIVGAADAGHASARITREWPDADLLVVKPLYLEPVPPDEPMKPRPKPMPVARPIREKGPKLNRLERRILALLLNGDARGSEMADMLGEQRMELYLTLQRLHEIGMIRSTKDKWALQTRQRQSE